MQAEANGGWWATFLKLAPPSGGAAFLNSLQQACEMAGREGRDMSPSKLSVLTMYVWFFEFPMRIICMHAYKSIRMHVCLYVHVYLIANQYSRLCSI